MSDEDCAALQRWFVTEGVKNWATKIAEANEALARVAPYRPELAKVMPFAPDGSHRDVVKPVLDLLRLGPVRR